MAARIRSFEALVLVDDLRARGWRVELSPDGGKVWLYGEPVEGRDLEKLRELKREVIEVLADERHWTVN